MYFFTACTLQGGKVTMGDETRGRAQ